MATDTANPPRTLDESYAIARNTSDLTVAGGLVSAEGFYNKTTDILLASGMMAAAGRNALGVALGEMLGEWGRCEKPAKPSDALIAARAAELLDKKGRPDLHRAKAEAIALYGRAMRERAMRLRSRATVLGMLTEWALRRGVDVDLVPLALFHWLAPACPVCDGTGRTAAKWPIRGGICNHCHGTGTWARPLGASVIHEHIADAIGKAKSGMAGKLR
jgi:hypothetical protein